MGKSLLFRGETPPSLNKVKGYFTQKGQNELEAEHFFMFYQFKQWRSKKGNLITNWKSLASGWIMSAIRMQTPDPSSNTQ
ncbi:MAG: hypothetical protein E6Q24_04715 [Chitinophagaceae bacterium]|nr:MAG: hypothetical protein E6Q24_04715 [Chitinophagaceae bacterium]